VHLRLAPTARALATTAGAALAYTVACPPYTLSAAAWLIPGLLVAPCRGLTPARAALRGVVFALLMGFGVTGWAFHAALQYFDFNRLVAAGFVVCVWLLYGGIPFGLLLAAYARWSERVPAAARAPLGAWCWVAMEILRTTLFTGMPWEFLGHTQFRALWLVQVADLGGVHAVAFVMALVSVGVADLLLDACRSRTGLEISRRLAPTAALLLATFAYGHVAQTRYSTPPRAPTRKVALVQGNVPNAYRWQRSHMERTLGTYVSLTESTRAERPDLVIWPENAVDFYLEREPLLRKELAQAAALAPGGLLVGSPRLAGITEARNSAQLLAADGTVTARYDKQRLVPFAEASLFPAAQAAEPVYGPGPTAEPLATPIGRLGTMICYEVTFPRLVNDLVRRGAQLLVNLSNDSWLDAGDGAAPDQHFSMAIFRAIETRRDLVRVAASGASGFVDAYGRIVATVPRGTARAIVAHVHLREGLTPYVRWGDTWVALFGIVIAVGLRRRNREPRS
jgi:apolipoprotein N-acyltransferase